MSAIDKLDASLLALLRTSVTHLDRKAMDIVWPTIQSVSADFDALRAELAPDQAPVCIGLDGNVRPQLFEPSALTPILPESYDAPAEKTLRDEFAIAALPAVISGRSWAHLPGDEKIPAWGVCAYAVADAMLVARGVPP